MQLRSLILCLIFKLQHHPLLAFPDEAEAYAYSAEFLMSHEGKFASAAGGTQVSCITVDVTPAQHSPPDYRTRWPDRVLQSIFGIVIIPVIHPLPYITGHIIETKCICALLSNWLTGNRV